MKQPLLTLSALATAMLLSGCAGLHLPAVSAETPAPAAAAAPAPAAATTAPAPSGEKK